MRIPVTSIFAAALLLATASARAATVHVASNGVNGSGCGTSQSPCRSIGRAIANAASGDMIVVGPGVYGDLNHDGVLGQPGEEDPATFSPGCGCVLGINKDVTVLSSGGAAQTVIDGASVGANANVLVIASAQLGKPGKGFMVTGLSGSGSAIVVDGSPVKIMGNQVFMQGSGSGIAPVTNDGEEVLIQGNQVIFAGTGISVSGAGKTAKQNQLSGCAAGIVAGSGAVVSGNIITDASSFGILVSGTPEVAGNAIYGSGSIGLAVGGTASDGAVVQKNNIFDNGQAGTMLANCGLYNQGAAGVVATNNYWGSSAGPGSDPSDTFCNDMLGTTIWTPFATKPFKVKAPVKP